jgi:hypothetical protein
MAMISATAEVDLDPGRAFHIVLEELASELERGGLRFDTGPAGCVTAGSLVVGRVLSWRPGEQVTLEWRTQDWNPA